MSCSACGGMSAGFLNGANSFDLYRGLTRVLKLTVTVCGEPYDLTDATIYFTAKCSVDMTQNAVQKTSGVGGGIAIDADPRNGTALITFSVADTSAIPVGSYVFDIVVQTSTGERYLVVGPGAMRMLQGVVRF